MIVDTSIIIPLVRIGRLELLRKFFRKIKITKDVYDEIKAGDIGVSEIEEGINNWILIRDVENKKSIIGLSESEDIEKADASIILLAKEEKDSLISNDYFLIAVGKSKGIDCWWMTTFILQCLKKKLVSKKEAKDILLELIESGMRLDNVVYALILREIDKI
jgi:predicted nucleic acid-binding protein